ncbi:MAG TPA: hypothetical protein VHM01_07390 [Alphaproteobacteria bacterium]|nr:hypothetical protein [Alphaproteobacteria bacterium]
MRDVRFGGLTRRQLETYRFIERFIAAHGYSPSYEEIKEALGSRSKSLVHAIVQALAARGFITVLPGRSRSIALATVPEAPAA